jgi:methionyl-tRNA formyltransferase
MQMALELDAGDVLAKDAIEISPSMTGGELHDRLSDVGANLLVKTLDNLDNIVAEPQDESLVTYANKLDKSECLINFDVNSVDLFNKIRAFNPYPAMYFMYNGERFKIFEIEIVEQNGIAGEILEGNNNLIIATKDKAVMVHKIQREGKQAMRIEELLRGFKFEKGIII